MDATLGTASLPKMKRPAMDLQVHCMIIVSDWGSVAWDIEGNLEPCPDSLYLKLTQGWYPPPEPARLSTAHVVA